MNIFAELALTAAARTLLLGAAGLVVLLLAARVPVLPRLRLAGVLLASLPLVAAFTLLEPGLSDRLARTVEVAAVVPAPPSPAASMAIPESPAEPPAPRGLPAPLANALLAAWALGAGVAVVALAARLVTWHRRRRAWPEITGGATLQVWRETCESASWTARTPLLRGSAGHPVFLVGLMRPALVVPTDLAPSAAPAVFAHELAHLRRRDLVRAFAVEIVRALFWWNPFVHALAARLRDWTEIACDLAAAGPDRRAYARTLLHEAERVTAAPLVPACAFLRRPFSLETRITEILNERSDPMKLLRLTATTLLVAAATATFAVRLAVAADATEIIQPTQKKPWPPGVDIQIDEVSGDAGASGDAGGFRVGGTYVVKGRYRMPADQGPFSLYLGNTIDAKLVKDGVAPVAITHPQGGQYQELKGGEGTFTFTATMRLPGTVHLSLYDPQSTNPQDNCVGGVYLGKVTGEEPSTSQTGIAPEALKGKIVSVMVGETVTPATFLTELSRVTGIKCHYDAPEGEEASVSGGYTNMPADKVFSEVTRFLGLTLTWRGNEAYFAKM